MAPELIHTVGALRERVAAWRRCGERVVLVPTMGNLHAGHLRLVELACNQGGRVVVSIFVNPLQFGPQEDYHVYPRTLEEDCRRLAGQGVDGIFAPDETVIYPRGVGDHTRVNVPGLSELLEGVARPGHFEGVATVVLKLFNMVMPDVAVFGEKDFQQLMIIRRMVEDLALPVRIVAAPTVREDDGLAMSSRNAYLTPQQRSVAPVLYQVLRRLADTLMTTRVPYTALCEEGRARLAAAGLQPEYVAVRRYDDFGEPAVDDARLVVLAAAFLGSTRLIDNVVVDRRG